MRGTSYVIPGDKSISHRAVILASLSNRMCTVENFLVAEDCLCTVDAFRAMDVPIVRKGTALQIQGVGLDGLKAPTESDLVRQLRHDHAFADGRLDRSAL